MNNKRVAVNTIILYFRMFVIMLTTLYTSRIVLQALGVVDYGIYNVVGGVVTFLGFLNGTLSTASSRYITVALGENNAIKMKQVFASVLQINVFLALIVLLLSESVGLWFLFNKMVIPSDRMTAALWVYHFSILTVMLNIISVPYNASIIAHEKMKSFAYISIFDAFAKLFIAYLLTIDINCDRLIIYSFLLFVIQLIDRIIYGHYCVSRFPETKYKPYYNKKLIRELLSFISWSAYGSFAAVGFNQGLNILLNLFFGPAVNAARAIAVQVQNAVTSFNANFHVAFNPQLIKTVARKDFESTKKLLFLSSRISFYLLCILGIPIITEIEYVLRFWLGEFPPIAVIFIQLMLIISIWQSLANGLRIVNQAEGNIKKFQQRECTILLMIIPISYLFLKLGFRAEIVLIVHLMCELLANIVRMFVVLPKFKIQIKEYIFKIYIRIFPVFILPLISSFIVHLFLKEDSFIRLIVNTVVVELLLFITIYYIGLYNDEKNAIIKFVKSRLLKDNK